MNIKLASGKTTMALRLLSFALREKQRKNND
jgi:hypothetical protein